MDDKRNQKNIIDRISYAYTRRIKKWVFCPACTGGKMKIDRKSTVWTCETCGYKVSADEFEGEHICWYCEKCNSYLNNQEGFEINASKHICRHCGYENEISGQNAKKICSDCGTIIPNSDSALCDKCKSIRQQKMKDRLKIAGKVTLGIAVAVLTAILDRDDTSKENDNLLVSSGGADEKDEAEDNDEVYGMGPGRFPTCKTCGSTMTQFDGWAWYTCPVCENRVRIIEDEETWYDELFRTGKRRHRSDFELADFCRGGDLSEE